MGEFMKKHFPELAKDKPKEIRWKKFLYDKVNSIAPACYGCLDSHDCFKCDVLN